MIDRAWTRRLAVAAVAACALVIGVAAANGADPPRS